MVTPSLDPSGDNKHHSDDTVKFVLKAKCIVNPEASKEAIDPDELYINHTGTYLKLILSLS